MLPFRDVKVWEKAHLLCLHLHKLTAGFPEDERHALALHMRRAAVYVACKIAEGCGRNVDKDVARNLESARGYALELEYFLLLARDIGYVSGDDYTTANDQLTEVQKMLYGFLRFVKARMAGEKAGKADRPDHTEALEVALP